MPNVLAVALAAIAISAAVAVAVLHRGFFAQLSHLERSLYFFLVLAADRNGVSFYAHDRICTELELTLDEYLAVRDRLIDLGGPAPRMDQPEGGTKGWRAAWRRCSSPSRA